MDRRQRAEALDRFERATQLPLLVLALAMVPLLIAPLVVRLPSAVDDAFDAAEWFIWAAFAFQYFVRLFLVERRLAFVRREWPDLLIIVLPFLRPLRVVQSARALQALRLLRLVAFVGKGALGAKRLVVRHSLHYAVLAITAVVIAAAATVLIVEEGAGGSINSFGDALWWAVTTITTVGYGDTFPVTAAGRGVAAFLMLTGIALFGVVTANLATFLIGRDTEPEEDVAAGRLDEVLRRLERLEAQLQDRSS